MAGNEKQNFQEFDDMEDNDVYLDPNQFEVIEVNEDSNMDDVADQLMDVLNRCKEKPSTPGIESDEQVEDGREEEANEHSQSSVEEGIERMATHIFKKHTDAVFSCAVSSCGSVVATGGKDDMAYVWNTYTGEVLLQCSGHKESVTSVCLSHDSQYVATSDMDGLVQVFRIRDGEMVFSFETGGGGEEDDQENWLCWHRSSHILFCGTQHTGVWVWLIPQGTTKTIPHYDAPVTCGVCAPDGKRLVIGYADDRVRVVDVKTALPLLVDAQGSGSRQGGAEGGGSEVLSVACCPDNVVALSGHRDGLAKLFNSNTGKVITTINMNEYHHHHQQQQQAGADLEGGVEAVGFCPTQPTLAVLADLLGTVAVYDVSKQALRHLLRQPDGITRLVFPPSGAPLALTAGLDGVARLYDCQAGRLTARLTGHEGPLLGLSVDGSGTIVTTCSEDGTARVYSIGGDCS